MMTLNDSIRVNVPVYEAYNQWTQFETFPEFMTDLREVSQLDDRHVRWHAEFAGHDVAWHSQITEQIPDEIIAWQSRFGPRNSGYVEFEPISERSTQVTVQVDFEPEGLLDHLGDAPGVADVLLHRQLERFKTFLEQRGRATGAWRGVIPPAGGQTS